MCFFSFRRSQGFTLLELMVALAVLGVLLAIAVPSFRSVTANSALRSCTTDLITAINTARADAVNTRQVVTLTANSGSAAWQSGWKLDYANPSANDKIFAACEGGVTVAGPAGGTLPFDLQGRAATATDFFICDSRADETGRQISVSRLGLITNQDYGSCNG